MKTLLLLFTACQISAQIPTDSALFAQLAKHYDFRAAALKIEHKQEKRAAWWELAPSIGTAYTLEGKPRLGVSFNPIRVLDFIFNRKKERRLLAAALLSLKVAHDADSLRLAAAILDYRNAATASPVTDSIATVQRQLFEISQGQFTCLEISPEQFFQKKLGYLQTLEATEQRRRELAEKAFRVLTLAAGSL